MVPVLLMVLAPLVGLKVPGARVVLVVLSHWKVRKVLEVMVESVERVEVASSLSSVLWAMLEFP